MKLRSFLILSIMKARGFKMIVLNFTAISQNQTECLLSHKLSVVVVVIVINRSIHSLCMFRV